MENPLWSCIYRIPREEKARFELLRSLPVFTGLNNRELMMVERMLQERHYSRGELIFNESEPGAGLYIIKKGEVLITKSVINAETIPLATIKEGSFFGELALLDEIPRSASAHTGAETILLALCQPDLEGLIDRNPRIAVKILRNLSRLICQRLIKANETIEVLQHCNNALEGQIKERDA